MRYSPFSILAICTLSIAADAQDFYSQELNNLADISRLPRYRDGQIDQLSSYDRTGGNDDGFSGKYSYVAKEAAGLVMADLKGPGVVNRIWTPTPTTDTVKFYFDGESKPRIAIPFIELFTGKTFPFLAPLSGNQIGGYYCYLPIPYEKSLKIIYTGSILRFHQTQYRTLGNNDQVKSFSNDLVTSHEESFKRVAAVWNRQQSPLLGYGKVIKSKKVSVSLRGGSESAIFTATGGGRIVGIELDAAPLAGRYRRIGLTARWDAENTDAVDLPLHDFFGFAFGKASMQSVFLGSNSDALYCYLPMPFDQSAEIKLNYTPIPSDPQELLVSGTVYYTDDKRDVAREGKFYAQARRRYNAPSGEAHLISDVKGKGHFVGTLLMAQGLEEGHTRFFEGDDQATIDGKLRLHGTGSEDYFNGGWYAVMDRWDRGISLPIHGSLDYNQMSSRTGGYRLYLNDKLNFNTAFRLTIEHQPDAKENVKTDYTSVGLFYAEKPQFENTPILIDGQVKKIAHRNKLTAVGMTYTLYWLCHANFEDPAIVFSMKKSEQWYATIDAESVPIAQIHLGELDKGKYKMQVEYGPGNGTGFSIWQRSNQVSSWIQAKTPSDKKIVDAGEIEITDELKTITIRKKKDDTSVSILSFTFEKID